MERGGVDKDGDRRHLGVRGGSVFVHVGSTRPLGFGLHLWRRGKGKDRGRGGGGLREKNKNKMRAIWELEQKEFSAIFTYRCFTHTAQVIIKDIYGLPFLSAV